MKANAAEIKPTSTGALKLVKLVNTSDIFFKFFMINCLKEFFDVNFRFIHFRKMAVRVSDLKAKCSKQRLDFNYISETKVEQPKYKKYDHYC